MLLCEHSIVLVTTFIVSKEIKKLFNLLIDGSKLLHQVLFVSNVLHQLSDTLVQSFFELSIEIKQVLFISLGGHSHIQFIQIA
jgi:hypothetical protein